MADERKMILAVDDTQVQLRIIQSVLRDEFEVRLAKSGGMALTALDRITPDLILLDIEMPDMSGFEIMEEIKRRPQLKDIPVIFITAHAGPEIAAQAARTRAQGYIVKPFDSKILRDAVYRALGTAGADG
ncbi:MAG: response regulator [Desulfovibrio sp.]|nr:response regulator [Desulfovibrio sp.]